MAELAAQLSAENTAALAAEQDAPDAHASYEAAVLAFHNALAAWKAADEAYSVARTYRVALEKAVEDAYQAMKKNPDPNSAA